MPYFPPASGGGGGGGGAAPLSAYQSIPLAPRAGDYYPFPNTGAFGSLGMVSNQAYAVPFGVAKPVTALSGKARIRVTATVAGALVFGALYKCNDSMLPTELITDMGAIDAGVAGGHTFGTPFKLETVGYYAVVINTFQYTGISVQNIDCASGASVGSGTVDPFGQGGMLGNGYAAGSVTAWPATFPTNPGIFSFSPRVALTFFVP